MEDYARMTPNLAALRALAAQHGQEHIFRWWDELSEAEQASLLAQAAEIDFPLMDRLIREHVLTQSTTVLPDDLQPLDPVPLPRTEAERSARQRAVAVGEEAIRSGHVAALVVAGGSGSRLGYPEPKGIFPAGFATEKSLFRLHAEKIRAARRRYAGAPIPWYVMTSLEEDNDAKTKAYFAEQEYFGLPRDEVEFFHQDSMPAVGLDGRLLMRTRGSVATSPNGHGGTLAALRRSEALDHLKQRGIRVVSYFQVDNPLVHLIDPAFIGLHIETGSEFSSKSLPKRDPEEGLGVFCTSGGNVLVVEYSDLPEDKKIAKRSDETLLYNAGSIAIHAFDVGFLDRVTKNGVGLPFHRARKRVSCIDGRGVEVKLNKDEKNGFKFEKFIFDALPYARNPLVMTVDRAEEFAPIKNKDAEDSPTTAAQAQTDRYGGWLEELRIPVLRDRRGHVIGCIDISPLIATNAEELRRHLPPGYRFGGYLNLQP